jgi:hypothetical protein
MLFFNFCLKFDVNWTCGERLKKQNGGYIYVGRPDLAIWVKSVRYAVELHKGLGEPLFSRKKC